MTQSFGLGFRRGGSAVSWPCQAISYSVAALWTCW
jgi:hypothetical protein